MDTQTDSGTFNKWESLIQSQSFFIPDLEDQHTSLPDVPRLPLCPAVVAEIANVTQ